MSADTSLRKLSRISILAAAYVALTVLPPLANLSYGPIQVRIAEALTVLPYVSSWSVWGLYVGCVVANLASPFLAWDVTLGGLSTLAAALATARMPRSYLAPLPPVIINAVVVSTYVSRLSGVPYSVTALYIGLGEAVAAYGIGFPFLLLVERHPRLKRLISGEM